MTRKIAAVIFAVVGCSVPNFATDTANPGTPDAARSTKKIDSKVIERVRLSGSARVFVRLDVQIKTQEKLRPNEKQAQLDQIRSAQDAVLKELAGTHYKLTRKFDVVPTLAMEMGQDALAVLERSSHVLRVYEIEKVYLDPGEIVPNRDK